MLKFLSRLVARRSAAHDYSQQISVGYRANLHNCDYCLYKNKWTEDFTAEECATKYGCDWYKQPYINVTPLHNEEIESTYKPNNEGVLLYNKTRVTRAIRVKGWPLYLQLIGCDDSDAQCNARCWYHQERLNNKVTVSTCAHSHGCSRSGSFFDLLVPSNLDLRQQFFDELNSMNP